MEDYYQGQTKHILTNTVNYLIQNQDKKFNWSDIAFFHRWWTDQNTDIKEKVMDLVKEQRYVLFTTLSKTLIDGILHTYL